MIVVLAGPAAYTVATIGTAHTGGSPTVGPAQASREQGSGWGESTSNPELDGVLMGAGTRWSAAVSRSSTAASLELASRTAVMAIGGFGGTDPTPTLSRFQEYVHSGQVRSYVVEQQNGRGRGRGFDSRGPDAAIRAWVAANFAPRTVGSAVVYDLRVPKT